MLKHASWIHSTITHRFFTPYKAHIHRLPYLTLHLVSNHTQRQHSCLFQRALESSSTMVEANKDGEEFIRLTECQKKGLMSQIHIHALKVPKQRCHALLHVLVKYVDALDMGECAIC